MFYKAVKLLQIAGWNEFADVTFSQISTDQKIDCRTHCQSNAGVDESCQGAKQVPSHETGRLTGERGKNYLENLDDCKN